MVSIIRERRPQCCDLCGKVEELRPYGPNREWICFSCGMKDEESAKRAFFATLEKVLKGKIKKLKKKGEEP